MLKRIYIKYQLTYNTPIPPSVVHHNGSKVFNQTRIGRRWVGHTTPHRYILINIFVIPTYHSLLNNTVVILYYCIYYTVVFCYRTAIKKKWIPNITFSQRSRVLESCVMKPELDASAVYCIISV